MLLRKSSLLNLRIYEIHCREDEEFLNVDVCGTYVVATVL
jgi:hypothetical protein